MSPSAPCLVVYASLNQVSRLKRRLYRGGVYVDMVRNAAVPGCARMQFRAALRGRSAAGDSQRLAGVGD